MKKGKIILSALAFLTAIGGALAFKANSKFSNGNLYTRSGSPLAYHQIPCTTTSTNAGSCSVSGTIYTYSGTPLTYHVFTGSKFNTTDGGK